MDKLISMIQGRIKRQKEALLQSEGELIMAIEARDAREAKSRAANLDLPLSDPSKIGKK